MSVQDKSCPQGNTGLVCTAAPLSRAGAGPLIRPCSSRALHGALRCWKLLLTADRTAVPTHSGSLSSLLPGAGPAAALATPASKRGATLVSSLLTAAPSTYCRASQGPGVRVGDVRDREAGRGRGRHGEAREGARGCRLRGRGSGGRGGLQGRRQREAVFPLERSARFRRGAIRGAVDPPRPARGAGGAGAARWKRGGRLLGAEEGLPELPGGAFLEDQSSTWLGPPEAATPTASRPAQSPGRQPTWSKR